VGPPRDTGLALGAADEDEEAVLRAFFRNGRLTEIPAKESKRRIVLERIAVEFEPGVRYDERAVNAIVRRFHTRSRRDPPLLGRRRLPRSRSRGVLAQRRPRDALSPVPPRATRALGGELDRLGAPGRGRLHGVDRRAQALR
jgi:hypothetical protein